MAIRDVLVPELLARFGDRGPVLGTPPDTIATFPAAHPDVGDLLIWDDGDEATVEVRRITHGHFSSYDRSLSDDDHALKISEAVVAFLARVFADRVVFWTDGVGLSGGWKTFADDEPIVPSRWGTQSLVWSGPLPDG